MIKIKYLAICDGNVVAHIVEHDKFGLVYLFLESKLDLVHSIRLYDFEKMEEVDNQDILDLLLFAFPPLQTSDVNTNSHDPI